MCILHCILEDQNVDSDSSDAQDQNVQEKDVKPEHLANERYLLELI